MQERHYRAHIEGRETYGIYTVTSSDTTKLIVFDIDTMDPAVRIRIFEALRKLRVQEHSLLFESSGRKGFHIWLPLADWYPANLAYFAARAVLQVAGVTVEAYPKQPTVGDGYGNLIKLPLGVHRVSGEKSRLFGRWVDVRPLENDELARLAEYYTEAPRPVYEPVDPTTRSGPTTSTCRPRAPVR